MRTQLNYGPVVVFALLATLLLAPVYATATPAKGEYGRSSEGVKAYLIADVGWGMLAGNVFSGSIEDTYVRYGGGFGMQHKQFFAEFTYKTGGESWRNSLALTGFETPLSTGADFTTQEVMMKFGIARTEGRFRFPIGVSIGYITFDSPLTLEGIPYEVETSGWYIGPWAGAEVRVARWLAVGASVEYSMGVETRRATPADYYYAQNPNSLPTLGGPVTTAPVGMSYFDTIGFFNHDYQYSGDQPGYLIQLRTVIYLPNF